MTTRRDWIKKSALIASAVAVPNVLKSAVNLDDESILVKPALKPCQLNVGDTVAIVSPAGAIWDETLIAEFEKKLHSLGFKTKLGKSLTEKYGFLAGTDELRTQELHEFFSDDSVKAIFSAKGGWGCARILPYLDYQLIQRNPKIIMGFSDITSLLNAITEKTGLVTFHGPVGNSSWGEFSLSYFKKATMLHTPFEMIPPVNEKDKPVTVVSGKAKGKLYGGNLSVLTAMLGSEFFPQWKNGILFLEETAEEPYKLDRMLTHLKLAGVFDRLNGIVFGKCSKCEAEEPEKAFTYQQVIEMHLKEINVPSFYNSMIGHVENKYTLPIGIEVEIDADKGTIRTLEGAVS